MKTLKQVEDNISLHKTLIETINELQFKGFNSDNMENSKQEAFGTILKLEATKINYR